MDCNDYNPSIHPLATEEKNRLDDDCDGQMDEGNTLGDAAGQFLTGGCGIIQSVPSRTTLGAGILFLTELFGIIGLAWLWGRRKR
jgi:hypothetical protein